MQSIWIHLAVSLIALPALAADRLARTPDEFNAAAKIARPGDTITLADGTWTDADLRIAAMGTKDAPITVRSQTPGRTVLTGASRLRVGGGHLIVEGLWFRNPSPSTPEVIELRLDSKHPAHQCRVTQCAVTNDPDIRPAGTAIKGRWVSLYGSWHRIDHCWFEGKTTEGTTMVVWLGDEPEGGHLISSNYFGARPRLGKNGGETIRLGDSETSSRSARCVVEKNVFEHCNGETEIISNKSCDNHFIGNAFIDCEGTLTLRHGHRASVERNWFFGHHRKLTGGVRIIGEDHRVLNNYFEGLDGDGFRCAIVFMNGIPDTTANGYQQVKRANVIGNLIVDCKHAFMIGLADNDKATLPPVDTVIADNLVHCPGSTLIEAPSSLDGIQWKGNVMNGSALGIASTGGIEIEPLTRIKKDASGLWRPMNEGPLGSAGPPSVSVPPSRATAGPDWRRQHPR